MSAPKTNRQLQADETKQKIFESARALLEERPYEKITIRDIVKKAGVSVGTYYVYFPSKIDVYFEIYHLTNKYFLEIIKPQLIQETAKEKVLFYFDEIAKNIITGFGVQVAKLMFNSNNKLIAPRLREHSTVRTLEEILREGMKSGEFNSTLPADEAVLYLMICARGIIFHWCALDGEYDLLGNMHKYVQLMMKAFLPPEEKNTQESVCISSQNDLHFYWT